ncbi:rap guanine nucleotide exchange factor 4-like [Ctenocephalides felis]|uniref:rap guanine nucleotide exchange factor 4-like n=1 Tax=Ctenocephalides felis TaxID=7515 RepID=UPI000E6E2043|nr:rap guanine nucleotide exchange factor 4-like [Ctenocephalides felis]
MIKEQLHASGLKPCDRNLRDAELITCRLKRVEQLCQLPTSVLQQLAMCGYYEDLEKGVTLFRQGDPGQCWYAVLGGSVDVKLIQPDVDPKIPVTLCSLGVGATFGESILHDLPRESTVTTRTTCELLRVEQHDFRLIWEKNKELMSELVANPKLKNGFGPGVCLTGTQREGSPTGKSSHSLDGPNPAEPITEAPSPAMARIGWALRVILLSETGGCLKDRKLSGKPVRRCAPGTELVDWLVALSPAVHGRLQAQGMWQALLEEGVIAHVAHEQPFKDKCFLYRFRQDEDPPGGATTGSNNNALPSMEELARAEEHVRDALAALAHRASDALLRMILRKPSHERTQDDLETIYEELLHITALSHLSNSVKRELSAVIVFEAHPQASTVRK